MKTCYIARGLPGSGKSTAVRKAAALRRINGNSVYICSTDDYWFDGYGQYKWDVKLIGKSHIWNFNRFCNAIDAGGDAVFVDNTNLTKREYGKYVDYASTNGYGIIYLFSQTPWRWDVDECYKRNTHGVPHEVITAMYLRFQGPKL